MSDNAYIDLSDPTVYVVKLWVCGNEIADWMGCLYRPSATAPLRQVGRIRLHADDKIFDSADHKEPFTVWPKGDITPEQFEADCESAAIKIAESFSAPLLSTRVDGGIAEFVEAIKRAPLDEFFHTKTIVGEAGETPESLLKRTKRKRQR